MTKSNFNFDKEVNDLVNKLSFKVAYAAKNDEECIRMNFSDVEYLVKKIHYIYALGYVHHALNFNNSKDAFDYITNNKE